jgi:porin
MKRKAHDSSHLCSIRPGVLLLGAALLAPAAAVHADVREPVAGVSIEPSIDVDVFGNVAGGANRGARVLGRYDLSVDVDTTEANLWRDGHFRFHLFGIAGSSPSEMVGDTQTLSNIDALQGSKLLEAYYEHAFLDNHLSVLAGLYLQDSEFEVLEYAGLFLNSSFGVSPELSQIGPSIYPSPSFGTRIKYQADNGIYALGAVYDGVPGDPDRPRGTHVQFQDGDGVVTSLEVGIASNAPGDAAEGDGSGRYSKLGVGGWHSTTSFDDYAGVARDDNSGIYVIGEAALTEQLGVFAQLGFALGDRNQIGSYIGAGFNYTGLLPGRPEDTFGVAVAHARNTDRFIANTGTERAETAIEFTYSMQLTEHISVQPDIQYIINPGTDPELDDAVVIGARVGIAF